MVIASNGYKVVVGSGAFKALNAFLAKLHHTQYFILGDENTIRSCLPVLIINCPLLGNAHIIEVDSGEQSKSLETSAMLWQTLLENEADRRCLLINLGGGMVSDLGGFCASVYKRGIDFVHVPTSLLAMADASVGSKTAIDLFAIKNVIGTFAEPKGVFVYPDFLETLPLRHYQNGLSEIYKIALVADKTLWNRLRKPSTDIGQLELIIKSIELKNNIVIKDPFDKALRKCLNFGHSIGHAVEAIMLNTQEPMLHGEAVVIGMIMESHVALQKKLITKNIFSEIVSTLGSSFELRRLPVDLFERIPSLIKNDKKNANGKILLALISGIGKPKWDVPVTERQIRKAIEYYTSNCAW